MSALTVTICIPAYNAESTVSHTLDSLLAQTYHNTEIVVSDNSSVDATRRVVREYALSGVRLVSCPLPPVRTGSLLDNCLSAANNWNSLVQLGTGELMTIYHADDVYMPTIVEEEVCFLESHPECSAVFALGHVIGPDRRPLRARNPSHAILRKRRVFDLPGVLEAMLEGRLELHSPTVMLRRSAWEEAGSFDGRFEQALDVEFWLRLARMGNIGVLNKPLYYRRISPSQDSAQGATLYRYSERPVHRVFDSFLSDGAIRARIPPAAIAADAFVRAGERAAAAVNYLAEGNHAAGIGMLEATRKYSCVKVASYAQTLPRPALRVLAGKGLRGASLLGVGQQVARRLSGSRLLFGRLG